MTVIGNYTILEVIMCGIDWGILGTWVGSIGTFISFVILGFFAFQQNKINKRQFLLSRSQLYIDNSVQLLEVINQITTQIIESSLEQEGQALLTKLSEKIDNIYFNSALYLSEEVNQFIEPVRSSIRLMLYDYDNYLYGKSVIKSLKEDPEKTISLRKEVMMIDYTAYYDYNSLDLIAFSYKDINKLHDYCNTRLKSILDRKDSLLGKNLQWNYSPQSISKVYKKYMTA